ncbi:Crp/Fnr family transcriptional regulator [Fluviicola taffensis]|uniref:Cyclic nucleotide-binding protein n=1 Tax=Fluviicola taffensis (strain DSM 16823 / NCIMB 13979 / RW262) TaxID=755732 RepID=F2IH83_FLUTR|nr:Crp/Fnr family transcriptional regulator [Fluviicola taffensis]AEA42638.1 cyclic nucleotide-binding protein [Fluviicola taffensis DSM 16823]
MKPADLIAIIEKNELIENLVILERNEFLKTAGSIDTNIYFIEEGSLRVYVIDVHEERTIRFGYQNNILVSLDSFLTETPSEFVIQAIKKTVVKIIPKIAFMRFIYENEDHQKLWIQILEDLVVQQIEREKDLLISSPKERFERVLKRSPQLFQEIPNRHIANYLRMTPETLSRLKKS